MGVNFLIAFVGGILSFISPCVLPLIPMYIAYISGISVKEIQGDKKPVAKTLFNSLAFVLGFTLIFSLLGILFYVISSGLGAYKVWFERVGGLILVIFGLQISGVINIPFLNFSAQTGGNKKNASLWSSFVMGLVFGAGWTPCVGPILAGILFSATTVNSVTVTVLLLVTYSLGLGIPFILTGVLTRALLSVFGFIKKHYKIVEIVSGIFLILLGVALMFGLLQALARVNIEAGDLETRLADNAPPSIRVKSPDDGELIEGYSTSLILRLSDSSGVALLTIEGPDKTYLAENPGEAYTNEIPAGGTYLIYADDVKGLRSTTNIIEFVTSGDSVTAYLKDE